MSLLDIIKLSFTLDEGRRFLVEQINSYTGREVKGLTYLSFITSPLHVPARWVFDGRPPEGGIAVCEQFFDREYIEDLNEKLERKGQEEIDEILDAD